MFGLGFTEIMIIAVIAILFLGPDKLPSAMIDIAKFFRNTKKTLNTVKNSLEEEMNISDMKQEALSYKKELLQASEDLNKATDITQVGAQLTNLNDDLLDDEISTKPQTPQAPAKPEKVTFEKKPKIKEDTTNV